MTWVFGCLPSPTGSPGHSITFFRMCLFRKFYLKRNAPSAIQRWSASGVFAVPSDRLSTVVCLPCSEIICRSVGLCSLSIAQLLFGFCIFVENRSDCKQNLVLRKSGNFFISYPNVLRSTKIFLMENKQENRFRSKIPQIIRSEKDRRCFIMNQKKNCNTMCFVYRWFRWKRDC